jgi:hypothetical protein
LKQKFVGISLFFCLVAPLVATFTCLHYQKSLVRKEVKHQMIAGMDKDELVLLKFTKEESQTKLRWEHSKEFEYNSQMYDIAEKEIKGDTIYYWCWWDHEETRLNRQLDDLVANVLGNNPQKRERQEKLVEFYKKLYWKSYSDSLALTEQISINYPIYKENYSSIYHTIPDPPPRFS